MTIDPQMTLGALVNAHPELAREFERRGLDYCCGGGQPWPTRARTSGLDPAVTVSELSAASTRRRRQKRGRRWAPADLVDHLEATHHRYLWDELPRLSALVAKVVSVHGGRHPELHAIAACYEEARADLEPHMAKEEQVLFPMIRELATASSLPSFHCGTLRNPISVMLREHDAVGELLAELRRLDQRLPAARRRLRLVRDVLRGAGRARSRHAPAHPQGEQPAVPARGSAWRPSCSEPVDDDARRRGRRGGLLGASVRDTRPTSAIAPTSSGSSATSTGRRRWTTCWDRCSPRPR